MTKEEREREERERMLSPGMTIEEYERIIGQSTDATNAAMAQKNASEASALSNIAITGTQAIATQTGRGANGQEGDYITQKEQQQNKDEATKAAVGATNSVGLGNNAEDIMKIATGENRGVSDMVQQALDAKKKQESAKRAEEALNAQKTAPTTRDFHNNEPELDEDAKYMRDIKAANERNNKLFSDYINQQVQRQKQAEEEMRRQEKADMWSTMGTGATELAAGIINMLGVGELNATNQVYHSYSQDWMKKSEERMRENRQRRQSMRDTLDRLNLQMAELKNAQSIKELEMARQLRKEKEAKELQEQQLKIKQQQYEDALKQQEIENAFKERQIAANEKAQARADKQTDATIALNRARLKDQRDATTTTMLTQGFVPDKNAPGGYRYDPTSAKKWIGNYSSTKPPKDGSGKELYLPVLDADGNINYANVRSREQKDLILKAAITAIKKDLPEEQAKQFEASLNMADSDETQEAILLEWIGKSPTMEKALKDFDVNYKGNHGAQKTFTGGQMSGEDFLSALNG